MISDFKSFTASFLCQIEITIGLSVNVLSHSTLSLSIIFQVFFTIKILLKRAVFRRNFPTGTA